MKMHQGLLWAAIWLVAPALALADITAVYQSEGTKMSISVRDQQHILMDVGKDHYILLNGDMTYSVGKEGKGWVAMDLAQLRHLASAFAGAANQSVNEISSIRDTGRTETVAGYKGKVFEVVDGKGKRFESVLTDDDDVVAVSAAMMRFAEQSAKNVGMTSFSIPKDKLPGRYTGFLRQDRDMQLVSVDTTNKGKGYFSLPSGVRMEAAPSMPGQGAMPGMPEGMDSEAMQKMMREGQKHMQDAMKKMQQMER